MNSSKIAVRYAKALFDLALERDVIDSVYRDMKTVSHLCAMEEVKAVINNPVISQQKRKEVILALTGDETDKLTVSFVALIFDHGRGDYLAASARNFIDLTRRHRGIREVTLTTAVPVSGRLKEEMATLISGKEKETIEFIEIVDRSVIGGFILKVDDAYIDASVRNRLNKYRKEFSLAGYAAE
ncbi:MAG: ATP synthase F1 subunit delta [Bacteroidales bacterium]|nr:ATP synthase F1 subunit delta [Bacteroidales bacterium]